MRSSVRSLDVGVRDAVAVLNRIPGVTTRASCEGATQQPAPHRHGELAYVLFRYPLPLHLRDFLLTQLDAVARIEDDGIYSRWPMHNREFLDRLVAAARAYLDQQASDRRAHLGWPLPRLRARFARELSRRQELRIALCIDCHDLVGEPHPASHRSVTLLRLAPDQEALWFAEFIRKPANALDPTLVATDGWEQLAARTQRGDFGAAFRRRWLRYRARMIADLTTRQLRIGTENLRRRGNDIDFFYNGTHALFVVEAG